MFKKRTAAAAVQRVQAGNRRWWTDHAMAYDWKTPIPIPALSAAWFAEIDQRFLHGARLFATDAAPFDRMIPFARLRGQQVLEIGCGMGLHTELLVRAGARVTSIDLSSRSVESTKRRLALKDLHATVIQADAEHLPFRSGSFDFVWSWGVIHHSSKTALIVRRISEVLTPTGEARVMVYNREGAAAWRVFVWDYLLRAGFRQRTFDEQLWVVSDGFSARFYVEDQLADLFRAFFHDVKVAVCGQDSDALPVPGTLRRLLMPTVSRQRLEQWQARRGGFLFVSAVKPF
jgi:2-polyprenyl-3-methyl-5-hydroxy-6-metoxy-1,4-benzoquinol methylase